MSGWFVLNSGFKVYGRCPVCHSPHIGYHKERPNGLKGISVRARGLTPACLDCGKSLPTQSQQEAKVGGRVLDFTKKRGPEGPLS